MPLLRAHRSLLLVIDLQERLLPHIHDAGAVEAGCAWLVGVAGALDVPVICSEHYPEGIGPTVASLRALVCAESVFRKDHFSCLAEPGFEERLRDAGRDQLVLAGVESHVCLMQTALELVDSGREVHVVRDAVGSRRPLDMETALARMAHGGVKLVTREMVAFEWLARGATDTFRDVHRRFLTQEGGHR